MLCDCIYFGTTLCRILKIQAETEPQEEERLEVRAVGPLIIAATILIGASGCNAFTPENQTISHDYSDEDSRGLYKRSINIEGMLLTVNSYSMVFSEYRGVKPQAKGYFLIVEYDITNESSDYGYFNPRIVSTVTKELGEYPLSKYGSEEFEEVNRETYELPSGETEKGYLLFEMPSGTVPDFLVFDMPNSDATGVIDLKDPND